LKTILVETFKEDGVLLVAIPMKATDQKLIMERADFEALLTLGVNPIFRYVQEIVITRNQCKSLSVVRLLLDVVAGEHVRFKNGLSYDLRRTNLIVTKGPSKYRTREQLKPEFSKTQWKLEYIERKKMVGKLTTKQSNADKLMQPARPLVNTVHKAPAAHKETWEAGDRKSDLGTRIPRHIYPKAQGMIAKQSEDGPHFHGKVTVPVPFASGPGEFESPNVDLQPGVI
jgi:hypothetical protein